MAEEVAGLPRTGVIVLDSDLSLEPDLARAFPGTTGIHVARVAYPGRVSAAALERAFDGIQAAARSLVPAHPELLVYACTSGSFFKGSRFEEGIRDALREHAPTAVTAISAVIDALVSLNARSIALLSPYSAAVTEVLVEFLRAKGIETTEVQLLFGDAEVDDVTLQSVGEADLQRAISAVSTDPNAIFVSCTGIRITHIIAALERSVEIPVVSSNLAVIRAIARHAGVEPAVRARVFAGLPAAAGGLQ